jgi:hypothetical protein
MCWSNLPPTGAGTSTFSENELSREKKTEENIRKEVTGFLLIIVKAS